MYNRKETRKAFRRAAAALQDAIGEAINDRHMALDTWGVVRLDHMHRAISKLETEFMNCTQDRNATEIEI